MRARHYNHQQEQDHHESEGNVSTSDSKIDSASHRIALFANGAVRAAILPYAPILVYQVSQIYHGEESISFDRYQSIDDKTFKQWSNLACRVAILVGLCSIGHSIGSNMKRVIYSRGPKQDDVTFGAIIGTVVALLAFSTGSNSYRELLLWRSLASVAAGAALCNPRATFYHTNKSKDSNSHGLGFHNIYKEHERVPVMWVFGFASIVLVGGLLYHPLRSNELFRQFSTGRILPSLVLLASCVLSGSIFVPKWCRCGGPYSSSAAKKLTFYRKESDDRLTSLPYADSLNKDFDAETGNHSAFMRRKSTLTSRSRIESNFSEMSEYFDCASVIGDDDLERDSFIDDCPETKARARGSEIAQYIDGKCVYSDGSPASIPSGSMLSSIPQEYLDICSGNRLKAGLMWEESQKWRIENDIWRIHTFPHKKFNFIKEHYRHILHGVSKEGYAIMYEFPGKMKLKAAFQNDLALDEMVFHHNYLWEYITNCVCERKEIQNMRTKYDNHSFERGAIVILDLSGFSMTHLSTAAMKYLKTAGDIAGSHYPLILRKAVVINAPFWISGAWSAVKQVLPESVQQSTSILSSDFLSSLREIIDDDQIPSELGGSSPYDFEQHPFEVDLIKLVKSGSLLSANNSAGPSQTIQPLLTQSSLGAIEDEKFSFDHINQKWVLHSDSKSSTHVDKSDDINSVRSGVSMALSAANWTTEITTSKGVSSRSRTNTLESMIEDEPYDEEMQTLPLHVDPSLSRDSNIADSSTSTTPIASNLSTPASEAVARKVLILISVMYGTVCAVQGALETALPLWMLAPPVLGGLGYDSRKSGVSIFCSSLVLVFFLRSKIAVGLSQLPTKAPLRAFRVGVGTQLILLIILAVVPAIVTTVTKKESVLVLTSTVIVIGGMALAILLGRAGAAVLHQISSKSFATISGRKSTFLGRCLDGSFTGFLGISGEVIGALFAALLFGWSTDAHRPFPFDGACIFCVLALICSFVYTLSLSLHVSVIGSFIDDVNPNTEANISRRPRSFSVVNHHMPSKCNLVGDLFAVPIGDMSSLIEDAKWSLASDTQRCGRKGL